MNPHESPYNDYVWQFGYDVVLFQICARTITIVWVPSGAGDPTAPPPHRSAVKNLMLGSPDFNRGEETALPEVAAGPLGCWDGLGKGGIPAEHQSSETEVSRRTVSGRSRVGRVSKVNHRDVKTSTRYSHLSDDALRSAANLAGEVLMQRPGEQPVSLPKPLKATF